jgi:ribonuclease HI
VAGAAVGGVLADIAVGAAGMGLTGELLTDAAAVGAVAVGGAAVYAATRPDEAGEAARFVGGAVANTTTAYAELAAVSAELALLEQQQKAQAAIDEKVAAAKALPEDIKTTVEKTVTETVAAAKAAPENLVDTVSSTVKSKLSAVQSTAKGQLDAARREIDARKPK